MSNFEDKVKGVMNTADSSNEFTKEDIEKNKTMAILSYLLFFVPLLTGDYKNSKYVKYHLNQGIVLWITAVCYSVISGILHSIIKVNGSCGYLWGYNIGNYCRVTPWWVSWPLGLVGLVIGVVGIIGLINAINGKAKELPVIGKYRVLK